MDDPTSRRCSRGRRQCRPNPRRRAVAGFRNEDSRYADDRLRRLWETSGTAALELVFAVVGFAVILLPAASAVAEVAAARAVADDAAAAVARAWSESESADRTVAAASVADWLQARSRRRLRVDVRCDPSCADFAATVVVTASVATGLRFPSVVYSVNRQQGDVYAP